MLCISNLKMSFRKLKLFLGFSTFLPSFHEFRLGIYQFVLFGYISTNLQELDPNTMICLKLYQDSNLFHALMANKNCSNKLYLGICLISFLVEFSCFLFSGSQLLLFYFVSLFKRNVNLNQQHLLVVLLTILMLFPFLIVLSKIGRREYKLQCREASCDHLSVQNLFQR